ncbi:MAG TPA: hypothetical protein VKZ53_18540 [Candidatus Angelobacter sp.]|nr:hypothetical protein [Candidatus Angelobacter sp.]
MTDLQFQRELWINAYINQIGGYPVGDPARQNFNPVLSIVKNVDGSIHRARTLDSPAYTFSDTERDALLNENES